MKDEVYEYFAASIQNGYIGKLTDIVEKAGGAKNLYFMNEDDMKSELGISSRLIKHIINMKENGDIEAKYERMLEKGIRFVTYKDRDYPQRLLNISSKPYALFIKGSLPDNNRGAVAIVGARQCSEYGRYMAEYFADRIARANIDIISGMAWGIDGIAQMAAVMAGGKSYAVTGCGVDIVYPRKNWELYERLITDGNGVISEYEPGSAAISQRFPPRNRIIAGLCDVLIVVEARQKSGTLITVDMANEQGKTIMVVPGRLTDPLSIGCLELIEDGAIPLIRVEQVMEEFADKIAGIHSDTEGDRDILDYGKNNDEEVNKNIISENERQLLQILSFDPVTAEDIAIQTGWSITNTLIILSQAEIHGLVKEISMGLFVRIAKVN